MKFKKNRPLTFECVLCEFPVVFATSSYQVPCQQCWCDMLIGSDTLESDKTQMCYQLPGAGSVVERPLSGWWIICGFLPRFWVAGAVEDVFLALVLSIRGNTASWILLVQDHVALYATHAALHSPWWADLLWELWEVFIGESSFYVDGLLYNAALCHFILGSVPRLFFSSHWWLVYILMWFMSMHYSGAPLWSEPPVVFMPFGDHRPSNQPKKSKN